MASAMKRVKVWDGVVRLTHAAWVGLLAGALVTSERQATVPLHARLGTALLGLLVLRVVWGFVGSRYARFSQFVQSPGVVLAAARDFARASPRLTVGHNPLAAVMVLLLLGAMGATCVTGVALLGRPESQPAGLVGAAHASSALVLPGLILVHVLGVLFSSSLEGQNLALGMVTGWKLAPGDAAVEPEVSRARRLVGLVLAAASGGAVVLWIWPRLPQ